MIEKNMDKQYTLRQAGERLGFSYSTIRRLTLVERKIEYIKIGHMSYRITERAIQYFLKRSTMPALEEGEKDGD